MSKELNISIFERLEQVDVRFGKILHLGAMLADGHEDGPDALRELVEYELYDNAKAELAKTLPWVADLGDNPDPWEFTERCFDNGTLGFLVEVEAATHEPLGDSLRISWGCYNSRWVYGETIEDVAKVAEAWGKERWEAAKAKATAQPVGEVQADA